MKNICTLVFCVLTTCTFSFSQTYPLRDRLDQVFINVDKMQISTGFLEEYGIALTRFTPFNGALSDSNKLDIATWRKVYATLYTARIDGANPLGTLAAVNTTIETTESNFATSIPVPLLYADYNSIRTDAITSNLLSASNNQLFDVPGRTQSPYTTRKLFAGAPSIGYAYTGTPQVLFKPELFYNASGKTLNNIAVDFGDGRGYLNALWNTPLAGAYITTGVKQIKIKLVFTDNTFAECQSSIEILNLGAAQVRFAIPADATLLFNASANHAGGTVFIKYSGTNTVQKIKKPLIVAEGYDISSIAPKLQLNYSLQDFLNAINNTGSYDFNIQLDLVGYDLIFLDYNNGTDDIRRNAALLQEVIAWVNAQKVLANSTEQNVVIGISMGGLVARYALANMTKQGVATQTRLLLTHDSPHRGANTPLGFQTLSRSLYETQLVQGLNLFDLLPEIRQAIMVQDAPATSQLLILRAGYFGTISSNTFLDGEYRTMITFSATGPQPAYKIEATSLGSECGVSSLSPGTELLRISGNFFISPTFFISRTSWNTEVIVNALPNFGPSQRVSKLRLWINFRLLFLISFDIDLANKERYSLANTLPWDGAPGGTQNVKQQAGAAVPTSNYSLGPFFNLSLGATYAGDFCFVPTVSALDVTNLDLAALSKVYVGGISPTNPARVNNFIAQEKIINTNFYNQTHPRFTPRNAQWIFNELQGVISTVNCSSACSIDFGASISGPGTVCINATYSVLNNTYSLPVTWSSSNPASLSINPTTGVAARINSFNGQATITVSVNSTCGSYLINKSVIVGSGIADPLFEQKTIVCPTGPYFYSILGRVTQVPDPNASYKWYIGTANRTNFVLKTTSSSNSTTVPGDAVDNLYHTLRVDITTACGTVSTAYQEGRYKASCSGGGGGTFARIFPNPASSQLTIGLSSSQANESNVKIETEEESDVDLTTDFVARLYDSFQQLVRSGPSKNGLVNFNIADLPNGIYYIHLINRDQIIRKQVLVSK